MLFATWIGSRAFSSLFIYITTMFVLAPAFLACVQIDVYVFEIWSFLKPLAVRSISQLRHKCFLRAGEKGSLFLLCVFFYVCGQCKRQ